MNVCNGWSRRRFPENVGRHSHRKFYGCLRRKPNRFESDFFAGILRFQEVFFFHQSGVLPHISEGGLKRQSVLYRSAARYSEDRFPAGQERIRLFWRLWFLNVQVCHYCAGVCYAVKNQKICTAFVIIRWHSGIRNSGTGTFARGYWPHNDLTEAVMSLGI